MNREEICSKLDIELINDKSEIKPAWRKLVLKYHPDRNKEHDAQKKFIEIQNLFEELIKTFNEPVQEYVSIRINMYQNNWDAATSANTNGTIHWG